MAFGVMRKPPQCGATVFWLAALVVAAAIGFSAPAQPAQAEERTGGAEIPVVLAATLPLEASRTLALIRRGGPFPYDKDGIVFRNRERLLPLAPNGFYHEYTVPPSYGAEQEPERDRESLRSRDRDSGHDRGARRIVCGSNSAGGVCYYTPDHYSSFQRIVG